VAPSPSRLKKLADLIVSEKVSAILLSPEGNVKTAETLGEETGVPVAMMDPATKGSADPPVDYYQEVLVGDLQVLSRLFPVNADLSGGSPE
jgi:ABC-type Zn uptake system ZnuABC Zn-binding protein ZnuA